MCSTRLGDGLTQAGRNRLNLKRLASVCFWKVDGNIRSRLGDDSPAKRQAFVGHVASLPSIKDQPMRAFYSRAIGSTSASYITASASCRPAFTKHFVPRLRSPHVSRFSSIASKMAPPKAAVDFLNFVNASPTRKLNPMPGSENLRGG